MDSSRTFGRNSQVSILQELFWKEDFIDTAELSEQEIWLALPTVEKEERAELLLALARHASSRAAHAQSLEIVQEALEVLEALGVRAPLAEVATCHWGIGFALRGLNQREKALKEIDLAISLFREAGHPFMDDVLRARAQWCAEIDDWEGTIATHLEALRQHEIEGNAELEAKAWLRLGIAKYQQKKFHEALENFEQARSKFRGQKLVADVARCDRWLADSYSEVGEGERAYEHARKSMDIASLTQDRQPLMFSEFVLGKSLRVLGKLDDAERHLDTCHGWAVLNGSSDVDWEFVVEVQSERVKVLRLQERQNEADEVEQQIQTVQEVIQ